jgi:uroporphyrinogen decarboxylase
MDPIENFLRILHFDGPQRAIGRLPVQVIRYTGNKHEAYDGSGGDDSPLGATWRDIWGTVWRKAHADVMGLPMGYPLARVEDLRGYRWPDPDDERICAAIYNQAGDFPGGDLLLGGSHRDTLWEKAYMLAGMETMMVRFFEEPDFVREVLHRIMDFQLGIARHYVKLGVKVAFLGDDLGEQSRPLLSPRLVNEFLLPEYRRLCLFYKEHGVLLRFHSCGNIEAFLDMFMDLEIDLLNPVQATANNLENVRARTQGRMTLYGGVSSGILMEGPPERIEREVRRLLWLLGRQGGYVCAPDQDMPYPPEHIQALADAVDRHGWYPLQAP